ncbi:MAG: transposase [Methylococcales bacterium]
MANTDSEILAGGTLFPRLLWPLLLFSLVHFLRRAFALYAVTPCGSRGSGRHDRGKLSRIVGRIREAWPKVRIVLLGDRGFCRKAIMSWCEEQGVEYGLGLAKNVRLKREASAEMAKVKADYDTQQCYPRIQGLLLPDSGQLVARKAGGGEGGDVSNRISFFRLARSRFFNSAVPVS